MIRSGIVMRGQESSRVVKYCHAWSSIVMHGQVLSGVLTCGQVLSGVVRNRHV